MKTAISVPDEVFEAAEVFAQRHGLSRSQLYSSAVSEFIATHRTERVTEALNRIYGQETSELDSGLAELQAQAVESETW